jgi:histidinol dehydrogenase
MKKYLQPNLTEWDQLIQRPVFNQQDLSELVLDIFENVRKRGDQALLAYAAKFDGCILNQIAVNETEFEAAEADVSEELKAAIQLAKSNIEQFHNAQQLQREIIETQPGVNCWREARAIERVGLYIPGGSAPLFSTILMLAIPAQLAGCREIILCTPPDKNGQINPAVLYTAKLTGVTKVYKVGGAQAIAAMAFGTATIPAVYKIFGPGNQYVTKAKELVQQFGVAIDMPAGPSEVLVIADKTCNPAFVAADLLSQAEHGPDSQVILLSDDESILDACITEVQKQLAKLPRVEVAQKALISSKAILLADLETCFAFSNSYGPEHLIIASTQASDYLNLIQNAGSVFLGNYSCESAGDYASGTNHTLPTNGYAKNYSGVSLDSFQKKITFQKLSEKGIQNIGPAIELMAAAEGLDAHKNAVTLRLKSLES